MLPLLRRALWSWPETYAPSPSPQRGCNNRLCGAKSMAEAEASPLLPDDKGVPVQSFADILDNLDKRVREGNIEEFTPISTGFAELDMSIGGGFRPGQLVLLSGPAGVGKTSFTMQLARNIASTRQALCLFACYEHETDHLAQRLIS